MKVLTVVGARPQFVKAATVSRALAGHPGAREVLVHTGQHHDENMSKIFFDELGIPEPDHHLGVAGGGHGAMTGRMLERVEAVIEGERPDWVLVYGDTNSTLAGALAAAKLHVPVAHVEAGLRSFNRRMPEEVNRVLTDHAADLLFAPTDAAVAHLRREGIDGARVRKVGDVMYDAALHYARAAERESAVLERLALERGGYVLATVHRAENTDDPARLAAVLGGLAEVAETIPVVLPLHPRTRGRAAALPGGGDLLGRLTVTEPLGYLDMVRMERHAAVVATDSGGVQKEAFFHRVPCVTLRDETEWVELVELGWNRLAPPRSAGEVARAVRAAVGTAGTEAWPYGDGRAAHHVVDALLEAA
ncbi:MAG TPA: UDP-N-acetylglucosamine 2-epimerase (non-hydrolyzing) [Longimicrobium sp.]|nr:UDP-N-acetylglucosamine 2-epimerase (non-hydrolyzing) [Longimicrobium sp.]